MLRNLFLLVPLQNETVKKTLAHTVNWISFKAAGGNEDNPQLKERMARRCQMMEMLSSTLMTNILLVLIIIGLWAQLNK